MNFISYIAGPQLIGIIFYLIGVIMQRFPPKKIVALYGYRTNASMKNQQTWDEANRFSARWMASYGISIFVFGIILTLIVNTFVTPAKTQSLILGIALFISGIVSALLILIVTEKHLKKTFGYKQDEIC